MKENVLASLDMMWKGMLAIFIVIMVIFFIVFIMNAITAHRKKIREQKTDLPDQNDIEQR